MKEKISKLIEISEYLKDNESVIQLKCLEKSLEDNSYLLSIMGEFSSGKSSMINNFFGRRILPVHKTETTARITFIKYGEEESVELLFSDGTREFVSLEESLDMWQNGKKADLIDRIESITISIQSDLLKNGLIIADTPGTNTVIDKHIELTENLIANSDRVLYVLGKQISDTDKRFVKTIQAFGTDVVFVRTFMDQIKSNEENVIDTIEKEHSVLSGISSGEVFFVSNEKQSEYYNEIFSLQAYLSCTIAENVHKAIKESVERKLLFFARKQEVKILNRQAELDLILSNEKVEYEQQKTDLLSMLARFEENLEQKRVQVKNKFEKTKIHAKEELEFNKDNEEKRLLIKINNTSLAEFSSEYKDELGQLVREACIRMRDRYVDCFERIIRENKALFIEEMKQNKELSVLIAEIPDNLDEADLQMNSFKDRMMALKVLKEQLQSELIEIDAKNQEFENKNEEIEEERKAIHKSLEDIQSQLNNFPPYVAKYITVEGDHSCEESFKVVGDILDWATILIPGKTWAKLGERVMNAGAKGAKLIKAIQVADTLTDGARGIAKVAKVVNGRKKVISPTVPEQVKPTILDCIDLGYWFSKIGKSFDIPDTKIVDIEYENKYISDKQNIEREMRIQVRRELEKRKQQEELKTKEDENRLLKEITVRKERSVQEQIHELEMEIEKEKKAALVKLIRNYYVSVIKDNLDHFKKYILEEVLAEVNEKMNNYINTYDFRIKNDILLKKQEIEELEKKYNSTERELLERESMICKGYSDFLKVVLS